MGFAIPPSPVSLHEETHHGVALLNATETYPHNVLKQEPMIHDPVGDMLRAVFRQAGAASASDMVRRRS